MRKKLPLGVTSLSKMIDRNYIYVDKTDLIAEIANGDGSYFLSRPRRFGKSTLANALHELFANGLGKFQGLKIEQNGLYKDDKTYKVLHLDFSGQNQKNVDITHSLRETLVIQLEFNNLDFDVQDANPCTLWEKFLLRQDKSSLVLLIDEYDALLTNVLDQPEEFAYRRTVFQDFFERTKKYSDKFRFVFITGVSSYSSVNIFSGFNNLIDLSLKPKYGALLGYTQEELEFYFKDYIQQAADKLNQKKNTDEYSYDVILHQLKQYYDGYSFDQDASSHVYNPWSILSFLDDPASEFQNYWLDTGGATPTLLVKYLEQKCGSGFEFERFLDLDQTFSVEINKLKTNVVGLDAQDFPFEAVLYQTGYLSIKSSSKRFIKLGIPNLEVQTAYSEVILEFLNKQSSGHLGDNFMQALETAWEQKQLDTVKQMMNQVINSWSYESLARFNESGFRDLFKLTLVFLGAENIKSEAPNAVGRSDLIFDIKDVCFVCEFKVATRLTEVESKLEEAENQIKANKYGNVLGAKKVVALAIVVVNQSKVADEAAVREIEVIKEVDL